MIHSKFVRAELVIQIVKQLTPPILLRLAKTLVRRESRFIRNSLMRPSYLVQFKTYDEAMLHCSNKGYENSAIVKVVFDKTIQANARLKSNQVFDFSSMRVISALGLSKSDGSLKVIDFGGASGHHFDIAEKAYEDKLDLKWHVVETTAMANFARKRANNRLRFYDNVIEAQRDFGTVDLVFSSGTLHYCPDPISLLKELVSINAKFIFITRTALAESEDSIVVIHKSFLSTNGPGPLEQGISDSAIYYPTVFVPKQSFEDILAEKYDVKFRIVEEAAVYKVKNGAINHYGYFCIRKD